MVEIHGTCADGFEPVRDAFAKNFEAGAEQGASVAMTVDGEFVVDLWAGERNDAGDPWEADTIVNVYSTTKTMAATSVLMCIDRGLLDPDEPVATYWPEFAANGKEGVTVAHVMAHAAGVSGFDPKISVEDLYDWDRVTSQLASQAPWWEPGTASGYHAVSQGNLQGELVRRVTGKTIGTFFREEIAEPLGADFHIGLDAVHDDRVADLVPPEMTMADADPDALRAIGIDPDSIAMRTLGSVPLDATEPRTRAWRGAEIPAAGGTGNARSVARVHSALACGGTVDGVTLMSPATVDRALTPVISGPDHVLGMDMTFGLGFGLRSDWMPLPNDRSMFWGGWGGSIAVVDTENRVSIAYVMNRMAADLLGDPRGGGIVAGAYTALGLQVDGGITPV